MGNNIMHSPVNMISTENSDITTSSAVFHEQGSDSHTIYIHPVLVGIMPQQCSWWHLRNTQSTVGQMYNAFHDRVQ